MDSESQFSRVQLMQCFRITVYGERFCPMKIGRIRGMALYPGIFTGWPISCRTWVGLTLIWDVPPSCPTAQPLLSISYQPKQNQADGGTA